MAIISKHRLTRKTSNRLSIGSKRTAPRRSRKVNTRSHYGSMFFAVLALTVVSTAGFFGIVASVLAGS